MIEQMGLALSLSDDCSFDNFLTVANPGVHVVTYIREHFIRGHFIREQFGAEQDSLVYLWGMEGSGRSHLLQATCHDSVTQGKTVQYLPLSELLAYPADQVVAELEHVDVVCIDEINLISEAGDWLDALFHFFNRSRSTGTCLLISADVPPAQLALGLADLQSRLSAATIFQLPPYSDTEKTQVLQYRAKCLGLELSDDAARFLLNRAPRQLGSLIEKLRELDRSSLAHQRSLTIPFIKQVFSW